MFKYKILKPLPLVAPAPVRQYQPAIRGAWGESVPNPWDKITYAKWVETVKSEFKVGDLICMRGTMVHSAGKSAPFYYTIESVIEIHSHAFFDTHYEEPLCLNVITAAGFRMTRAPSSVRKLTSEELDLVYIQDKASKLSPV